MSLRLVLVAALAALVLPASALAAPDRNATVSAAAPTATWDGGPVTGLIVIVADDDDTLLTVEQPGSLTVALAEPDDTALDIDLQIYRSDDAGEPIGEPVAEALTGSAEETVTAEVEAGKYLVRVSGFIALEGFYKGTASLTPSSAAPTVPAPGAGPPAAAADKAPTASVSKAGKSGFSGSASDDKGVKRVEVGVVKIAGKKCTQLTKKGTFTKQRKCGRPTTWLAAKGSRAWSFKPKKGLKKGKYVVYVRAVDSAGKAGTPVRKGFTVK